MKAPHWPKLGLIVGIGASAGGLAVAVGGIYQIWANNPTLVDAASRLAYTVQANAFARAVEAARRARPRTLEIAP